MKKIIARVIITIMLSVTILSNCFEYYDVSCDVSNDLLITEGFTVSDEFLKALSNPETGAFSEDALQKDIDVNHDGILTRDEVKKRGDLCLDLTDCSITDWSDLMYFNSLQRLKIINADFSKNIFDNISQDCELTILTIKDCYNCESLSGISQFQWLKRLWFESNDVISCLSFSDNSSIINLKISDSEVVHFEELGKMNLKELTINSKSLSNITTILPTIKTLEKLDVTNCELECIYHIGKHPRLKELDASDNKIYSINYDQIRYIENKVDLSNNDISDINWYEHVNAATNRVLDLTGNPLSYDAIADIIEYNFALKDKLVGIENTSEHIELSEETRFEWLSLDLLRFEVEDESIIRINDNVIEFLKPGKTKVQICYKNDKFGTEYYIEYDAKVYVDGNNTVVPSVQPSEFPTETIIVSGDVNSDSIISADDALAVLKHAAKLEILSDEELLRADVKVDNVIDASDALDILKIAAKLK